MGGMFGGPGGGGPSGPRRSKDIIHALKVTLEDLYKGKTSKLSLKKTVNCKDCKGLGGKEGAVKTCTACKGNGVRFVTRQMGNIIQKFQSVCTECNGEGTIINAKDRCKTCNGKKTFEESKILEVHIDPGMANGQRIVFSGEGDQGPNIIPGDVVFVIDEQPHERFTRKGDDLIYQVKIDLLTALAGGSFAFKHLDGQYVKVDIIPGEVIGPDTVKMITGKGMPAYKHQNPGNMLVEFSVEFPKDNFATPEQLAALEKILPPRPALDLPKGADPEEVVLDHVDTSRYRSAGDVDMDDDEDGHPGGPGVQCASQ